MVAGKCNLGWLCQLSIRLISQRCHERLRYLPDLVFSAPEVGISADNHSIRELGFALRPLYDLLSIKTQVLHGEQTLTSTSVSPHATIRDVRL